MGGDYPQYKPFHPPRDRVFDVQSRILNILLDENELISSGRAHDCETAAISVGPGWGLVGCFRFLNKPTTSVNDNDTRIKSQMGIKIHIYRDIEDLVICNTRCYNPHHSNVGCVWSRLGADAGERTRAQVRLPASPRSAHMLERLRGSLNPRPGSSMCRVVCTHVGLPACRCTGASLQGSYKEFCSRILQEILFKGASRNLLQGSFTEFPSRILQGIPFKPASRIHQQNLNRPRVLTELLEHLVVLVLQEIYPISKNEPGAASCLPPAPGALEPDTLCAPAPRVT